MKNRSAIFFALLLFFIAAGPFIYQKISDLRHPTSDLAAKPPAFTPDPELLRHGEEVERARDPWLRPELIDPNKPDLPGNVRVISKAEPSVAREGDGWAITFKQPEQR
jgi:hypothetical protein